MRVAWVVPGGVDPSGVEAVIPALLWQIERLSARHELHVFTLARDAKPKSYSLLGAQVHRVDGDRALRQGAALTRDLRTHGPFDVLHAFWAGTPGLLAGVAGRRLGVPMVLTVAGGELARCPAIGYGGQLRRRDRIVVSISLRLAQRRTVATSFMHDQVAGAGHDSAIVPLGVPAAQFVPASNRRAAPPWRLLHVASINQVKDPFTLLAAMKYVLQHRSDVRLDLVGLDTLQGAVEDKARALGLRDHVHFAGWQPISRVIEWYREADLLLVTSRHESGPVVALEAAACGVPVVGTRVGHIADWSPDLAVAVDVGDSSALGQAVLGLIADDARRVKLAAAARTFALAHDADWTADRFDGLYRTLART